MSLVSPLSLLWLLPFGGFLVLLYMLRMRRKDVKVPATFLWPQKTEEVRANTFLQKLRWNWLLALQLFALGLIILGFARPQLPRTGLLGKVSVIVIDVSASMGATDVSPSRLEAAKKEAKQLVNESKPGDRIAILIAGTNPTVLCPLSQDVSRQLDAISRAQLVDSETDMAESMRLAAALVGEADGGAIIVLSDGCFTKIENFAAGKARVEYKKIGSSDKNIAVSALGTSKTSRGQETFFSVTNYSTSAANVEVRLSSNENVLYRGTKQLEPGKTASETVIAPTTAKLVKAEILTPDQLASDNVLWSSTDQNANLKVLLVSKGNPFLARALALDPRVTVDTIDVVPTSAKPGMPAEYDVVIFDNLPQEPTNARGVISLGNPQGSPCATRFQISKSPIKIDSQSDHPILSSAELGDVYIDQFAQLTPSRNAQVIAESKGRPIVLVNDGDQRNVLVAFPVLESDFPLQVSFPIFVGNALSYVTGAVNSENLFVSAGQPINVSGEGALTVQGSGIKAQYPESKTLRLIRDLKRVGEYRFSYGASKASKDPQTQSVFAMLKSKTESSIAPQTGISVQGQAIAGKSAPAQLQDLFRWVALIVLIVLAGEWWLFARKS